MFKYFFFLIVSILFFSSTVLSAQYGENLELDTLIRKAVRNTEKSDFENSLNLYIQLLDLAEKKGSKEHLVLGYLNLGLLYWRINENETALNYYFKALDLAKEYNYIEHLNSIYNNIGIIYSINNDFETALENFHAALEISKEIDDSLKIAINLINIASVHSDSKNYDEAEKYLLKAKEILEVQNEHNYLAVIYNNLGEDLNDQKRYQEALKYFELVMDYADSTDIYYYSLYLNNLGNTLYMLQEYDSALQYVEKGLELSKRLGNKENIVSAYSLKAHIYHDSGKLNRALDNYNKSLAWKDSLLIERSQKWVSEMQMKYELGKKEKEVEFLEKKNRLNILIWTLSLVVSVIISFFIIYSIRNKHIKTKQRNEILKKERELVKIENDKTETENRYLHEQITVTEELNRIKEEKLKQKIQHKNRELTSQAMNNVNKNEALENIEEKLNKLDPDNITDTKQKIKEIKQLIKTNLNIENDWKIFKIHFEEVHKGFFQKLSSDFSELTQSDLRYCAYLVLNLNNKEIAQIFNISPDSIRKRKQRLKEKLNLDKDQDLSDFLNQYSY